MTIIDRTCTEVQGSENGFDRNRTARPLADYRDVPAYVLLGDPGAGKTTCFWRERQRAGDAGDFVSARDFVEFGVGSRPERQGRTLFIDGLDEIRAGSRDGRTALDRVRARLAELGQPPFRLSCREADWLGRNDLERLKAVAPEGEIKALRLDPLTSDDARRIARADERLDDAERFLHEAEERGFRELLANPQNLNTLIQAVGGGGRWPASRLEMFELACKRLTTEPNAEHRHSQRERPTETQIMEAAGRICALLLLSGFPGASSLPAGEESDARYPAIERLDPAQPGTATSAANAMIRVQRLALSSRLFAARNGRSSASQRLEPVHRHIAEFLAGRYLAQQIENGLPAARVAALITAQDGGVVTPHRGLSAWLAAHSKPARRELINRDPIGVGLYGDIAGFSTAEKRSLLQAVFRAAGQLDGLRYGAAATFAPLASSALEAEIGAKLTAKPESDNDQLSVKFLLRVLQHGAPMATLIKPIVAILHGTAWRREVKYAALDALIRQCADPDARTSKLKQVLADIRDGKLPDAHNELAATALEALYPETIGPSEIWGHLVHSHPQPTGEQFVGRHYCFWTHTLDQKTPDEDVPLLLDTLAAQRPDLALVDGGAGDGRAAAERLLARALAAESDKLTPQRLYAWLNAPARTEVEFLKLKQSHEVSKAESEVFGSPPSTGGQALETRESAAKVRTWLESHPEAYKAALLEGICRYTDDWNLKKKVALAKEYLRHATPPLDFGFWCLEQAKAVANTQPELARWLHAEALQRSEQGEEGLSRRLLDEATRQHPSLRPVPSDPEAAVNLRERGSLRERSCRNRAIHASYLERHRRRKQEWLDSVRSEAPALEQNRGAPWLLFHLAQRWFQRSRSQVPLLEWLGEELGGERDLVEATASGLRGVSDRDDVPDADEILRLHGESRTHYLSTPFLVSLDERALANSRLVETMTRRQKRQACAFYHSALTKHDSHPNWYRELVEKYPQTVASVLLSFARTELQMGRENVSGLWDLTHDAGHAELARLVVPALLRGFPVRRRVRQLPNLTRLLWAARQHVDRDELIEILEKKLAAKSMIVNQRVHWLAAGVVTAPDAYTDRLAEFIDGKEPRARQLARFLWSEHPAVFRPAELPPRALEVLIGQSGAAFSIYDLVDRPDHGRRHAMGRHNAQPESTLWNLAELIECLAASPAPEAGDSLRRLADDETLSRWRHHLRTAADRQAAVARDASCERPDLDRIRATLNNAAPANAADLAALALHRIDEVACSIRHANTNDWSQYWNQDSHGRPTDSKPENACRDALLSQLRQRLPAEVGAQPEGQYAASRRADIRLSCLGFHVPIEIKKQSHRDLYRAVRDQLVAGYAQDPATGGHGIFLALWFGDPDQAPPDHTGKRPGSPEELQQKLEAGLALQLTPEQQRKISVRVIDVSRP